MSSNPNHQTQYIGELELTHKTISFQGSTFALANVAKFDKYGVVRRNSISTIVMVIACIVIYYGVQHFREGFVFVAVAAVILYLGIMQRRRPKLYGVTLELNSGQRYSFFSEDGPGIQSLYAKINEAIHSEHPVNYLVNFSPGHIQLHSGDSYHINNSQVGAIGKNASATNTTFGGSRDENASKGQ